MTMQRDTSGGGMHITGSGNQINTRKAGGDQRQVYVNGGAEDNSLLLTA